MTALVNIMALYQKSVSDKQQIKEQISQIMAQKMIQTGGSKHYTRSEVDSMMTSSLQNILSLYIQSENERHSLTEQLRQLQTGSGVPVVNSSGVVKIVPPFAVPANKNFSIKVIQDYIDTVFGISFLELLNVKNLKDIDNSLNATLKTIDVKKNIIMFSYEHGDTTNATKTSDMFKKFLETDTTNLDPTGTDLIFTIKLNGNKPANVVLKSGAKELFDSKIELTKTNPNTTHIDLSANDKFIAQFATPNQHNGTNVDLNGSNKDATNMALNFIRQHLKEKMADGTIKPDLP